ncbi:MAG: DUF7230 family protein [Magnetovibrionaceae bacterium]
MSPSGKRPARRNPMAAQLPTFKPKVEQDPRTYKRHGKHKKSGPDQVDDPDRLDDDEDEDLL